jgi:hypothetical protein
MMWHDKKIKRIREGARTASEGRCDNGKMEQRNEQGVGKIVALVLDASGRDAQPGRGPCRVTASSGKERQQ